MYKYRNALFITGEFARHSIWRDGWKIESARNTYVSWRSEIRKNMDRGDAKACHQDGKKVCASKDRDGVVPNVEKCGRYIRVSHLQRTTTRRIENKVKDIKSSATIRQSLFHDPCFTSRSYRYSWVTDVVYCRDNRNLVNRENCSRKAALGRPRYNFKASVYLARRTKSDIS